MPTVLRSSGFRIVIYSNDHRPAHVHAISAEGEAVFVLNCPDGPLELREIYQLGRPRGVRFEGLAGTEVADAL